LGGRGAERRLLTGEEIREYKHAAKPGEGLTEQFLITSEKTTGAALCKASYADDHKRGRDEGHEGSQAGSSLICLLMSFREHGVSIQGCRMVIHDYDCVENKLNIEVFQ
jgi:hypothetical protein